MTLQLPPLALYVHMPWCVRKCPVLRFQLARGAGVDSAARSTSMRCSKISRSIAGAAQGRALVVDLLRRRHAEPVRAGGGRTLPGGVRARWSPSRRTSRSRSKPIPGTIEHGRFARLSRRRRQSRLARRADIRRGAPAHARPHPRQRRHRARGRRSCAAPASTTSTSTSCTVCRHRRSQQALADRRRGARARSRRTSRTTS